MTSGPEEIIEAGPGGRLIIELAMLGQSPTSAHPLAVSGESAAMTLLNLVEWRPDAPMTEMKPGDSGAILDVGNTMVVGRWKWEAPE